MTSRRPRGALGELEAAVMEALWSSGEPQSVRQVLDEVNRGRSTPLAYTTVMTVLARLSEKGAATREPAGRGFVYSAAAGDEATIAVDSVLRDYGDAAVARFVDLAAADPDLLRRLRALTEET